MIEKAKEQLMKARVFLGVVADTLLILAVLPIRMCITNDPDKSIVQHIKERLSHAHSRTTD